MTTTTDTRATHEVHDTQSQPAGAGHNFPNGQVTRGNQDQAAVGEPHSRTSHRVSDTQGRHVGAGPNHPGGQCSNGTHGEDAAGEANPRISQKIRDGQHQHAGAGSHFPDSHATTDTQSARAAGEANLLNGHSPSGDQSHHTVEHQTPQPANYRAVPKVSTSAGAQSSGDQLPGDYQALSVAASLPPEPANSPSAPTSTTPVLADPLLALTADILDDIEKVRIANENRLRQLTRNTTDKDGAERGFGLTIDHPDVARIAAIVAGFLCTSEVVLHLGLPKGPRRSVGCCLEHDAERNLKKKIRDHPLGPWIKEQKGIGEKQGARLLAALGDPYIRPELTYADGRVEPARPRKLSELNAYSGVHVIDFPSDQDPNDHSVQVSNVVGDPTSASHAARNGGQLHSAGGNQPPTGQECAGTQLRGAGGELTGSDPDHRARGNQKQRVGVAATRTRGQHMNWNPTARMRLTLIAAKIVEVGRGGPYREIYDQGRTKYADAIHKHPCKRCGPKGKPAPTGTPLSDGHKHARARRLVAKAVLKDLWREARRIHQLDNPPTVE